MSESFINRHGKKQTVDQAVDEMVSKETKKQTIDEPVMTKKKRRLPRMPKKFLFIPLIVVILLAISALIVADAARRDYQRQTAAMRSSVESVATKTSSTETSAIDAVQSITTQLDAATECTVALNLGAVEVYPPARDARQECLTTSDTYQKLKESLTMMSEIVSYLKAQREAIAPALAPPSDGAFASIPDSVKAWDKAVTELNKLPPPEMIKKAHQSLVQRVAVVRDAWRKLQSANNDQSVEAFKDTEKQLTSAYEELRGVGDELEQVIVELQDQVNDTASSLREQP